MQTFAADHAAAFDAYGWSYYTREWAEGWYPGYSDAWGSLIGAVGILYEQAGTAGQPLSRASGVVATYRESVHHQAVGSLSNIETLRANADGIRASWLADRRRAVDPDAPDGERVFALPPSRTPSRLQHFVDRLLRQGVEVHQLDEPATARSTVGTLGDEHAELELPAGTYLIPAAQPQGNLVRAFLELDTRYNETDLRKERADVEQGRGSNIYDVTSWNLAQSFGLDALWCELDDTGDRILAVADGPAGIAPTDGFPVAWVVDGDDDRAVLFAARALELGLAVHLSDREFTTGGRAFARGSLVVQRAENGDEVEELVEEAALAAGVLARETSTGRSPDEGPDLGGGHFSLLARPRIALLSNSPVSVGDYGHTWHHLDHELRLSTTVLDAQSFGRADLRRYNVLVLPPGRLSGWLADHGDSLAEWVRAGGTLIASGSAASAVAGSDAGLGSVALRRDALEDLETYAVAVERERARRATSRSTWTCSGTASRRTRAMPRARRRTGTRATTVPPASSTPTPTARTPGCAASRPAA